MADKDLYNVPDNAPQTTSQVYCRMATTFTSGPLIPHPITMSECGRYGDYFLSLYQEGINFMRFR